MSDLLARVCFLTHKWKNVDYPSLVRIVALKFSNTHAKIVALLISELESIIFDEVEG